LIGLDLQNRNCWRSRNGIGAFRIRGLRAQKIRGCGCQKKKSAEWQNSFVPERVV
jgi:hypothetical protein